MLHNITTILLFLLYFRLNKCSIGEHKRLVSKTLYKIGTRFVLFLFSALNFLSDVQQKYRIRFIDICWHNLQKLSSMI